MRQVKFLILLWVFTNCSLNLGFAKKIKSFKPVDPLQTSLVVNEDTGEILYSDKAHERVYPASLTKLMTLYLVFEAIDNGKLSFKEYIEVSPTAARMPPTRLGLKAGERITVEQAVDALVVKSANDAAVALAERLSDSEEAFARKMTIRARQLGMNNTFFKNASGLPNREQRTTAMDLAKLSIALHRDFPEKWSLCGKTSFIYKGKVIHGHNRVMRDYALAEAGKTGFIYDSGFNLTITAKNKNKRLVAVVTGGKSAYARDTKMVGLLDKHFGIKTTLSDKSTVKKASIKKGLVKTSVNKKKAKRIRSKRVTA